MRVVDMAQLTHLVQARLVQQIQAMVALAVMVAWPLVVLAALELSSFAILMFTMPPQRQRDLRQSP
jgi:hypothetical protein